MNCMYNAEICHLYISRYGHMQSVSVSVHHNLLSQALNDALTSLKKDSNMDVSFSVVSPEKLTGLSMYLHY